MGEIRVGTSGFAYDDWQGSFYPKGLDRDRRLAFYAERFPTVEVNYTHYRMPEPDRVRGMADRMREAGLDAATFKAPRSITHEAMPEGREQLAGDRLASFFDALEPAAERGVLDGLLVQFSHRAGPDVVEPGVEQVLEHDPPAGVFVEVRHPAFEQATHREGIHERLQPGGALVATDSPSAKVTNALDGEQAYFRFHGRNREMWFEEDPPGVHGSARYDDLYTESQIEELADRIDRARADRVRVFFNNHVGGQAPRNARQLMARLGLESPGGQASLDEF